jgi:peroxin-13
MDHALCAGLITALAGGCADPGYRGYLNEDEPFGYYSVGAGNPYAGTGYYDYSGPYSPYYYYGMLYGPYGMGGYWGDPYVGGGNGGRHR